MSEQRTGCGFPEHNIHQCNEQVKEQSLVPHVRGFIDTEMLT